MGWLITLGILLLIGFLPVGGRIRYNSEGLRVVVLAGPFRFTVVPAAKKEKKPEKKKEKAQPPKEEKLPTDPPAPKPAKKESGGPITDFLPLVKVALELVGEFITRLRFYHLEVKLIMAGDDKCALATHYG